MEQDREARERDRVSREQEKASLDLIQTQLAQQNAQGFYKEFGPWTTDASSIHVPPYPPYPFYPPYPQYQPQWQYPPGGYPGRTLQLIGGNPIGTPQQFSY